MLGGFVITSGEYDGDLPDADVFDVAVTDAETQEVPPIDDALVTLSPCAPPWSALNLTEAHLTDLTLEVAAHRDARTRPIGSDGSSLIALARME